jgi:Reverse transcriptase (RNA-dependent DNA polymerase)
LSESSRDGWLLTKTHFTFSPINSLHTVDITQLKLQSLSVHNNIVPAIEHNLVTDLLLLNLSSAFTTVNHSVLLSVLNKRFSITDTAHNWFRSYFASHTQSFLFGGHQTIPAPVDCGVPYGLAQGPFQFLCYTEDVCTDFDHHGVQHYTFADDMRVYVSGTCIEANAMRRKLADCFSDAAAWCASRRLQLNSDKSHVIWFASRANLRLIASHKLSVNCDSHAVQPSRSVRDLGVQLDDELSMVQHVSSVTRTYVYHVRRLRQVRRYVGEDAAVQQMLAFIISRLDYCTSVLAGVTSDDDCTSTTSADCSCQTNLQPAASRPRHTSATATAMAAGTGADYFRVVRILASYHLTRHRRSAAARPLCDDLGCVAKVHLITFRQGYTQNLATAFS